MSYYSIRLDDHGDVAVLRLNEPALLNAVSARMIDELGEALDLIGRSYRAMVLTGEGRAFCSGAKLSEELEEDLGLFLETHVNPLIDRLRDFPLPWVTAVRGACAGVGSSLALLGDMVVAGESAYFLQVFVRIGLVPDGGAFHLLVRTIGRVRALELMMLGDRLPARQALDWGLVNRVVADAEVEDAALALARRLACGPSLALTNIRKLAWEALDASWAQGLVKERETQTRLGYSADGREGIAAFLEKRQAHFKGI